MKYFIVIPLFLLSFYAKCQNSTSEIYSKIIENYTSSKFVVIKDSTSIGLPESNEAYLSYIKELIPKVQEETLSAFVRNNQYKLELNHSFFNSKLEIVFFSNAEMNFIFKKGDGWAEFYKKYQDANRILTLSAIGFNKNNTQALVYLGHVFNYKAGTGYLLLFELENGTWQIVNKCKIWQS